MTGPVVGSVIGFLIGMRPWVVVAVVMAGTVSAIISWTFIMDQIREWTSMIGDVIPLLVVFLLIAVIVSIRVKRLLESQALRNGAKRNGKDNR
jgi:peptidoglycan/LPS O-acetylase OafA/YrhL